MCSEYCDQDWTYAFFLCTGIDPYGSATLRMISFIFLEEYDY
jgi:hypothetical protein